ncbi:Versican core protein, partial [Stylophora pistillata]
MRCLTMFIALCVFGACQVLVQVFITAIESSTVFRSAYFLTLTDKQLKGFVVKRFESPGQPWCSHACLKNTWCTSTNFKLAPLTSDGEGICELNKHDNSVVKENTHLQFEEGGTFSVLLKGCPTTNSCENGGVCVYDEKKQSYSCQCRPPWNGETCTDLVTCDSHPRKNNGTCADGVNEYNCSCAPGFYGKRCEKIKAYLVQQEQLSTKSYAKKENAISSSLLEFTVCFFVKRKDINSASIQCLYSYAEASHQSGNGIAVCLNNPKLDVIVDASGS